MNHIRTLFVIGFMLSLCAGVVVGMVVSKKPDTSTVQPLPTTTSRPSRFDPLGLSADQKPKLDEILQVLREFDHSRMDKRHAYDQQKTNEIYNLIPDEKQPAYDAIQVGYLAKVQDLDKEHDRIRMEVEGKIKQLLTPKQWEIFSNMRQRGPGRNSRGGASNPVGPGMPPPGGPGKHGHNDAKFGDPKLNDSKLSDAKLIDAK